MKKLIYIVLLLGFGLGCFIISCAQSPQNGKQDLIDKSRQFKETLERLRIANQAFLKSIEKSDKDRKNALVENHKLEAMSLLNGEIKPSYESFTEALKSFDDPSVKIRLQDEATSLADYFNEFKGKVGDGKVSEGVKDFLPPVKNSLDKIEGILNNTKSTSPSPNKATNPSLKEDLTEQPPKGEGETTSIFQYLVWLIPIFVSVLISIGLLFMFKYDVERQLGLLQQRVSVIQRNIEGNQIELVNKISSVNQKFGLALENLQTDNRLGFQAEVRTLETRLNAIERNTRIVDRPPQTILTDLPEIHQPSREGSVADYLSRFAGGIRAKTAFMPNDALEPADGDAIYVLFQNERPRGDFIAIPIHPRFHSTQDYLHYSKFYDCDHPSSGEVWIVNPAQATYDEQSNQWRLHKRGKLQIK